MKAETWEICLSDIWIDYLGSKMSEGSEVELIRIFEEYRLTVSWCTSETSENMSLTLFAKARFTSLFFASIFLTRVAQCIERLQDNYPRTRDR